MLLGKPTMVKPSRTSFPRKAKLFASILFVTVLGIAWIFYNGTSGKVISHPWVTAFPDEIRNHDGWQHLPDSALCPIEATRVSEAIQLLERKSVRRLSPNEFTHLTGKTATPTDGIPFLIRAITAPGMGTGGLSVREKSNQIVVVYGWLSWGGSVTIEPLPVIAFLKHEPTDIFIGYSHAQ